jgi:hypothetical protein
MQNWNALSPEHPTRDPFCFAGAVAPASLQPCRSPEGHAMTMSVSLRLAVCVAAFAFIAAIVVGAV